MSKLTKRLIIIMLTFAIALGSMTASGVVYDAYKLTFGEARWQVKYNNLVTAVQTEITALGTLVVNWVSTVDSLTLIATAPTYSDASTFTLAGNFTALLTPGKRLVADCGADGLQPNTVVSCTYGAPTSTVVVTTANLTNKLAAVSYYATRNGLNTYGSGDIVAAEYGAPSWARLQAAVAVANASGRRLVLTPGTWPVSDNLPVSAPVNVVPGAILEVADAKTLALSGTLEAGPYQIFSCLAAGKVTLAAGAVTELYPEWWVANAAPGTTDMSPAILAAYTACQNTPKGKVKLLPTTYAIADLIFPTNWPNWPAGILIDGSGPGTKIVPAAGHTAGHFLMTFAGTAAAQTGWVSLQNLTIDGGSARTKGVLIQPSNNFRLKDITFLNILGTALEAERPYDLYCTRLRVYGCGSFDDNEAAVRMIADPLGATPSVSWGNQVYWTDCNVEAYQFRGLELLGCTAFNAQGGKVHGSLKTVTTSLGNVYIDGGGEIKFTNVILAHPHRAPALYIKDDPTYYSQVFLNACTFSQCESYDPGFPLYVVHYDAQHASSQLGINGCTFNISAGVTIGADDRLIYIDPDACIWRVAIGSNLYSTNSTANIVQDDRTSIARHTGAIMPEVHALNLVLGHDTTNGDILTIASGAITITQSFHRVDGEGAAADNLDTINGGRTGSILILGMTAAARVITVRDQSTSSGNIYLDGSTSKVLDKIEDKLVLFSPNGADWHQLSFSNNNAP